MDLNLLYVHSAKIGYGRFGAHLAESLSRLGVNIHDVLAGALGPREGSSEAICDTICWVSVAAHATGWYRGQRPILATMFEATKLPPSMHEGLHEFDTLIVPSMQNVDLFSKYHGNVKYLPLGVDPAVWHYTPRRPPGLFFDFLIGGSGKRKGTMLAHDAFVAVFGDEKWEHGSGPIPRLILKSPRAEEPIAHRRVSFVGGKLTAEEEVALYEDAHVYLQPSRGEGFGLQPLQAIAQGLPTVLTEAHGHAAFAHLGWPIGSTLTKADYFMQGDAGEWWEPNFDDLCDRMRWLYDHYDEACATAKTSAEVVAREFTWDRCAEGFLDIVGRDLHILRSPGEWYAPILKLYPVVTTRDAFFDVGGIPRQFYRGKEYYEPADVKRVLFDAELLDPVCLQGDDPGLHPDQLGRLEEYSASKEYCPHCSQRLNTQPTLSDDLYAEAIASHDENRQVTGVPG